MSKDTITIVGGGLAGSLMAIFLARRGIKVEVYEQLPDPRTEDVPAGRSINLALAERGIHALECIGLRRRVLEFAIPMRGRMIHDLEAAPELQAYGSRADEVIYAVHRAKLNSALLDAAESQPSVRVNFNRKLIGGNVDQGTLDFRDDRTRVIETVHAAHIVGADGAGSALRGLLEQATGAKASSDLLDHGYKELTIPPAADGGFRIEPHALHIWPRGGYMLIALPNHDQSFTATLFLANEGEPAFGTLKDATAVREFFAREFPDTDSLIPALEEEFFQRPTGVLGTVHCSCWHHRDKALLLGDAAHAIVPFHGQGMNCAFEDCEHLDRLIGEYGADWETIFSAFENERRKDAQAIATMALENYIEMRDSVRDPTFKLKKQLERLLEERHPDRFVPRYSMVMFHRVPYREALARGEIQADILDRLTDGIKHADQVDLKTADRLIQERLRKFSEY